MLISLLIAILVIGLLIWLIQMIPLPEPFRTVAIVIVAIIAIIWLLESLGGATGLGLRHPLL